MTDRGPGLQFEEATRRYGRRLALDRLSLTVERGAVTGLVGRNGAGKTTTLLLAHGLIFPDGGRIRVLGLDPVRDGLEVRRRCSLLSEETSLYPWMSVTEILDFAAALHPSWDRGLARDLSRRLELDGSQRIRTLSRGMRAKVALVLAVACRPELLLLDDPTAGLDPLVRLEILQGVLETVCGDGGAVVYASHLVHDLERVADRIAYLDGGRLELEGDLDELKATIRRVDAVFDGAPPARLDAPGLIDAQVDGRCARLVARAPEGALAGWLRDRGAVEVEESSMNLEEILVACLRRPGDRRARRDEEVAS